MSSLVSLSSACAPSTFASLQVFGTQILNIETHLVTNFSASVPAALRFTQPPIEFHNATFCNVTVSYTHPGQDDQVFAYAWLPIGNYNGRLQAVGGAGWAAGGTAFGFETMKGAVGDGYATITNDGGLTGDPSGGKDWALLSPGNVNLYKLNNLGSVSVNEQSIIGKALVKFFYGKLPSFSYWNGCSQGGRQGFVVAQRFPTAFDGISAGAPVMYIPDLLATVQWPQQVMNTLNQFPYPCELDALTAAAISACDSLDGVRDGIISDPAACLSTFNPFVLVGTPIACATTNTTLPITLAAATVANATWHGPASPAGKPLWYGLTPNTDLTGNSPLSGGVTGIALTNCTGTTCTGTTSPLSGPYLSLLIAKGSPSFSLSNLTNAEFASLIHAGKQQYSSLLATDDPDLSAFRAAGGKLVSYHGTADQNVPSEGTARYHRSVERWLGDEGEGKEVGEFWRHFEVPGLGHCFGGRSGNLEGLWEQLRGWVEEGREAPGRTGVGVVGVDGTVGRRVVCSFPERARYVEACGEVGEERCWVCGR